MKLPRQAIDEFKEIYKKELGKDITDEQAKKYGMKLLRLMALAQPVPLERFKELFKEEDKASSNLKEIENRFTSKGGRTKKKLNRK